MEIIVGCSALVSLSKKMKLKIGCERTDPNKNLLNLLCIVYFINDSLLRQLATYIPTHAQKLSFIKDTYFLLRTTVPFLGKQPQRLPVKAVKTCRADKTASRFPRRWF